MRNLYGMTPEKIKLRLAEVLGLRKAQISVRFLYTLKNSYNDIKGKTHEDGSKVYQITHTSKISKSEFANLVYLHREKLNKLFTIQFYGKTKFDGDGNEVWEELNSCTFNKVSIKN